MSNVFRHAALSRELTQEEWDKLLSVTRIKLDRMGIEEEAQAVRVHWPAGHAGPEAVLPAHEAMVMQNIREQFKDQALDIRINRHAFKLMYKGLYMVDIHIGVSAKPVHTLSSHELAQSTFASTLILTQKPAENVSTYDTEMLILD